MAVVAWSMAYASGQVPTYTELPPSVPAAHVSTLMNGDGPNPHAPTCGTIVYRKTGGTNVLFHTAVAGPDGWFVDRLVLDPASPTMRRVCSIQGGVFAPEGGTNYNVTMRIYSECPNDVANGGACPGTGDPRLLAEQAIPVPLPAGTFWTFDFDFGTPVLVPDVIWVGYRITGNAQAGPVVGGPPTIGTSADGDMALCSSAGGAAPTCTHNNTAVADDNFHFIVGANSTAVCSVPPAPGSTPENEPNCGEPEDTLNGGCNSNPFVFQPIANGQTIAGTVGTLNNARDQDWFEFTVPSGHSNLSLTVNAEFSPLLVMLNGVCPPTIITAVSGAPCTPTTLAVCAPAGTYRMIVQPSTFAGVTCGARYNASFTATACTPNPATDFCVDATNVGVGATPFTTVGATSDGPEAMTTGCTGDHVNDIWFRHTAAITGTITVNTCDPATTYDTTLTVYEGCDCNALLEVACSQNFPGCNTVPAPGGLGSSVDVSVTQGTCYLIRVGSPGVYSDPVNNSGAGVLNIVVPLNCPNQNNCGGVLGDLNLDTVVNGRDIKGFTDCWVTGPCVDTGCECADFDGSFDLGLSDVTAFVAALLQ